MAFVPANGSLKSRLMTHKGSKAPTGTQVLPHLTGGACLPLPNQPHRPAWDSRPCAPTYIHIINRHLLSTYAVPSIGLGAGDAGDNQSLLIPALSGLKAWRAINGHTDGGAGGKPTPHWDEGALRAWTVVREGLPEELSLEQESTGQVEDHRAEGVGGGLQAL